MITEYQAHGGAVNTSTSPKVQYAYSEMASGANHSRPVSMTYPNGRVIDFNYGVALDDAISRLSAMKQSTTTLESYDYLGLGTVVKRGHAESGVDLTYIKASGESNGEAGDQYAGLDRFGRIVDQRWRTSSVEKDRYQYRYDRDGNRLYRENMLASSTLSEIYWYDGLNQLKRYDRGQMAGPVNEWTFSTHWQTWDYDALGNMEAVNTDGTNQTRTHNKQNEITAVSGTTTPTFDANGNMTRDETGRNFYYDAWNRLAIVYDAANVNFLVALAYDGLGRRAYEHTPAQLTDLYYSAGWQVLEERVSGAATKSYVWSPVYVDAMVARDRDTDANGSLDERLYVLHDANFNVTGLVTTGGTVVERYTYDPYGVAQARDGSWTVTTAAYVWQYLHQGGRLSGESGLYAFRYRDYSPTLGRWVTMDPIGYESQSNNLYLYVLNNAINLVDPSGLKHPPFWQPESHHGPNPWPLPKAPYVYKPAIGPRRVYFGLFETTYISSIRLCDRDINAQGLDARGRTQVACANCITQHKGFVDVEGNGRGITDQKAKKGSKPQIDFGGSWTNTKCLACELANSKLLYGKAAGKSGRNATDEEIWDCISNSRMKYNYSISGGYHCRTWAEHTAKECGLNCWQKLSDYVGKYSEEAK